MSEVLTTLIEMADRLNRRQTITRTAYELLGETLADDERDLAELRLLLAGNQDLPLKSADSAANPPAPGQQ